eukprot:CAMPEP_0175640746 /NCGR_PEP_ID=MMETSP0097-20121207/4404_1 /TAXON_ID=311494 /ORGANISM="Alexandrium monilatum, Strain CCMP3105" /LENGTH=324 /DNA_ID=CAMNT_0016946501 /DNA_START=27 /DNA_END=1001 /DNA_ORIENTATION=+
MFNGTTVEVKLFAGATVRDLRAEVAKQRPPPEHKELRLVHNAQVLQDDVEVDGLDASLPLFAVLSQDSRTEVLLKVVSEYAGLTAGKAVDGVVAVGPMPSIFDVLQEMGGKAPDEEVTKLRRSPWSGGLLEFRGSEGSLLLPSLELTGLLAANGASKAQRATLSIGVNSDQFNRGLGVVLEASPLMEASAATEGLPWYTYCDLGVSKDKPGSAVKFHPGMHGGQLRVEGFGGFQNQSVGFTPESWSRSGRKLHTLEVTVGADGTNEVCLRGAEDGQVWRKAWSRALFDGQRLPAVYAWLDLGDTAENPLIVSPISLSLVMAALD